MKDFIKKLSKLLQIQLWFRSLIDGLFNFFDEDSKQRSRTNETGKFKKRYIFYFLFLILIGDLAYFNSLLSPPKSFLDRLKNSTDYELAEDVSVKIEFSDYKTNWQPIDVAKFRVEPSGSSLIKMVYYKIVLNLEKQKIPKGIYFPMVFGEWRLFKNNTLVDYGTDSKPLAFINDESSVFVIEIKPRIQEKIGMRSIFPPLIGNPDNLKELFSVMNEYKGFITRAFISQVLTLFLFIVLFLSIPSKPELLPFIIFFVLNILHGLTYFFKDYNMYTDIFSIDFYRDLEVFLSVARGFAIIWFVLEFFRFSKAVIKKQLISSMVFILFLSFPAVTYLSKLNLDLHSSIKLSFEILLLIYIFPIFFIKTSYIIFRLKYFLRGILAFCLGAVILYNYSANIMAYFFEGKSVVNVYSNNIYTYFVVALIIFLEFARSENVKQMLLKTIPKEHQEKINKRKEMHKKKEHIGFVLLLDIVDFSKLQKVAPQGVHSYSFIENLLKHVLRHFPNASILNGTGDGFYFAWEGEITLKSYEDIIDNVNALIKDKLSFEKLGIKNVSGYVKYRFSIGFGNYIVGIVEENNLSKEYSFGTLLTNLSRIINVSKKANTINTLLDDFLTLSFFKQYQKEANVDEVKEFIDKHGYRHLYAEEVINEDNVESAA